MNQQLANKKDFPYCKDIPYILGLNTVITSKLTSKSQTTVPQPVRKALGLQPGDQLRYEISGGQVILSRVEPDSLAEDPFASFNEWRSVEDEEAYGSL